MSMFGRISNRVKLGLSALSAGVFALQVLVTGFCLLSSQAHAMEGPMAEDMAVHCPKADLANAAGESRHDSGHDACFHCDDGEKYAKLSTGEAPAFSAQFVALFPIAQIEHVPAASGIDSIRLTTGPPRSSSLLYSTTQRIRI